MLHVQEYLRSGKTLEQLAIEHSVHASIKEDLVVLNYRQFTGNKTDPIAMECRGLVLQLKTWEVVARAFDRFFNAGDPAAATIDWSTAQALEKLDGSLVLLFYYNGVWRCSTRGSIDAVGGMPGAPERTFASVIWPLVDVDKLNPHVCYVLELVSPWNRVVKRYGEAALYLLTTRSWDTGWNELSEVYWIGEAHKQGWHIPGNLAVASMDDIQRAMDQYLGEMDEGFVVVDAAHNRIKCKTLSYVEIHKIASNGCPDYWRLIVTGKDDDIVAMFPEHAEAFAVRRERLAAKLASAQAAWLAARSAVQQKAFALSVKAHPLAPVLFQMRKAVWTGTVQEYWDTLEVDVATRLAEKRLED